MATLCENAPSAKMTPGQHGIVGDVDYRLRGLHLDGLSWFDVSKGEFREECLKKFRSAERLVRTN